MRPHLIALHILQLATFHIVEDTLEERFIPLSTSEKTHLTEHQVAYLLQRLSFLGATDGPEGALVCHSIQEGHSLHDLLGIVEVLIKEATLAIGEYLLDYRHDTILRICLGRKSPAKRHHGSLHSHDIHAYRRLQRFLLWEDTLRQAVGWLPVSEILLYDTHCLIGVKVATHTDGHIVGHIPFAIVLHDVAQRGVLEMLLRTDGGLSSIRMMWEENGIEGIVHLLEIIRKTHIELLIYCLQFSMETSDDHIAEALRLYHCPWFQGMARDILLIAGDVRTCIGIGSRGPYSCHHLVILVGNGILTGLIAETVYPRIDGTTLSLVGGLAINLILSLDAVKQWFLLLIILCAEAGGTLEHQMFQIVGKACTFGRIIPGAGTNSHIGLDAGFIGIDSKINLQTIFQGVDVCGQGVISQHRFFLGAGVMARLASSQDNAEAECHSQHASHGL